MDGKKLGGLKISVALPVLLAIAGCSGSQSADRAAVEIKGSNPGAAPQVAAPAQPGGFGGTSPEGIVNYDSYQAAVARSGDTVTTVANRIGLSASELGAYNGLSPDHPLRPGDELVLPQRPGGYGTTTPAPQPSTTFVPQGNTTGNTAIVATPLDGSGATATAQAPADTWSPDVAAAAINRANTFDNNRNLAAPPSSTEPLPPAPSAPGTLQPPQLGQYQTPGPTPPAARPVETLSTPQEQIAEPQVAIAQPATTSNSGPAPALRLIPPVRGTIVIGFQKGAGRARNDGIDYAAPANSPVVASANGEVALVSQSLGGLGTIVLVRHPGDYLTVYGRIENVNVIKGDLVSQGQQIGRVAATTEPRMHFEVRKGADSLDPERFF